MPVWRDGKGQCGRGLEVGVQICVFVCGLSVCANMHMFGGGRRPTIPSTCMMPLMMFAFKSHHDVSAIFGLRRQHDVSGMVASRASVASHFLGSPPLGRLLVASWSPPLLLLHVHRLLCRGLILWGLSA